MTSLEELINRPVPFLGRPLLSFGRKRSGGGSDIRPGATFRRNVKRNWIEIATVLRVASDAQGIEHVTYDLTILRNKVNVHPTPERRMLNLTSFRKLFQDLAPA